MTDSKEIVEPEAARRLFSLSGNVVQSDPGIPPNMLLTNYKQLFTSFYHWLEQENAKFFDEEMIKLDAWADDLKKSLEWEIKHLDVEIKKLESQRNEKRKKLFVAQD